MTTELSTLRSMRHPMAARVVVSISLVCLMTVARATTAEAQQPQAGAGESEVATAPVRMDGTVLFRVRGVSSLPAETRAGLITERLEGVASNREIAVESVRVEEVEGISRIVAGENSLIMGVAEADAQMEQVARQELALAHGRVLRQAIADYRAARSPEALRRSVMFAIGATVVALVVIAIVFLLWRRLDAFLHRRLGAHIRSVGIQSFEVMRAEQIWSGIRNLLLAIRGALLMVIALVYLGFTLGQFPRTRGLATDLAAFVLAPLQVLGDGLMANVPSLVFLLVLFIVVRILLRLVRLFFEAVQRRTVSLSNFDPEWAEPTYKIVRIAIVAFALIVAYPYIPGSNTAAFQGVSLFIGIVFSLGSSSAIANVIAGYMLTYRRALKIGDRVKIGDAFGDVMDMRLQVTHLRSVKNEEIIIPNSEILAGEVINYSSMAPTRGLILHTEIGIGYETPWRQVEGMLISAAQRTPGLLADPRPYVLLKKLGDFAIVYEINAFTNAAQSMAKLYSDLHQNILDVFNEYGVQIMTPAYEGDPEIPKVVAQKDWFMSPAVVPNEELRTKNEERPSPRRDS